MDNRPSWLLIGMITKAAIVLFGDSNKKLVYAKVRGQSGRDRHRIARSINRRPKTSGDTYFPLVETKSDKGQAGATN